MMVPDSLLLLQQKETTAIRIALVNMPFASVTRPSIQCGLLKALLVEAGHQVDVFYFNLRLAAVLSADTYAKLVAEGWRSSLGDWLFAAAAFGPRNDDALYLLTPDVSRLLAAAGLKVEELLQLRNYILPDLLDTWVNESDWSGYSVIGFTCTFEQSTAAFALARKLKERYPGLITLFGGGSFDLDNATEFVRKLEWIDYIVVGDADRSLPDLVARVARGESGNGVSGVVTRLNGVISSTPAQPFCDLDTLPDPDYDEYFATLKFLGPENALGSYRPQIPFQSARGCWWGQKHHCAFCGLNATGIAYRSRAPHMVYDELQRQSSRYRSLSFIAADTILDMKYIDTLFAWTRNSRHDYSLSYEIKANLTGTQLRTLMQGGVKVIQAGIESLSTHVLHLLNKGSSMLLNVRLLKWARYCGMSVEWNILAGLPGETIEDYNRQIELIRSIVHLYPPSGVWPIRLDKYSPYRISGNPHWRDIRPAAAYSFVYPPNLVDIPQIALLFEGKRTSQPTLDQGIRDLRRAVESWRTMWMNPTRPRLTYERAADWMRVEDRRDPQKPKTHWLNAQNAALYEYCSETARTAAAACVYLRESGQKDGEEDVHILLCEMRDTGLMVEEGGHFLSLAIPVNSRW